MKVSTTIITCQFDPFNLIISVESKEEAQALYAIFNHTRNTALLDGRVGPDAEQIRKAIGSNYYIREGLIANGIKSSEFYKPSL